MKPNFEEKTYESYFNSELDKKSDIYFPPGQVLEGSLGFDSSAFSRNRRLWRLLGHPYFWRPSFSGSFLKEIANEVEDALEFDLGNIPDMKANILFQYKRPEFITLSLGKEWQHWNRPYYRYDINKEQQQILESIDEKFKSKVLVMYAAPCTKDVNDLISKRKDIISHSNFTKAIDLKGHHRNTFIERGTFSIACSQPEKVNSLNIVNILKTRENELYESFSSNRDFILKFSSLVDDVCTEDAYFSKSYKSLKEEVEEFQEYKLLYNFLKMEIFREMTGTQWLIKI